jgi:hypothetical protein
MNETGAALARIAADMRARQTQMLAQEIDEQEAGLDLRGLWLSIHGQCKSRHDPSDTPTSVTGPADGNEI